MVKFLSGTSFDSGSVPVCTYWRSDVTTNKDEDFAEIQGTGDAFGDARTGGDELENDPQKRALGSQGQNSGTCIANAFFAREDITCFNGGDCNNSGQCLPCSKYRFEGMQLGISHSPPLSFLRNFFKGVTDSELRSPNFFAVGGRAVNESEQDQVPYHILLKNVMARLDKCCRWSVGNGLPDEFVLRPIIDGPDTKTITDVNGNQTQVKGITVTNSVFPDTVGTFFPVGTMVVAGWKDQPSFYLEPRTGLVKLGEGVIFPVGSSAGPRAELKSSAASATQPMIDAVNAAGQVCNDLNRSLAADASFFNNSLNTSDPATIASAESKLAATRANQEAACAAAQEAQNKGQQANARIALIVQYPDGSPFQALSQLGVNLANDLDAVATEVEKAAVAGEGLSSAQNASAKAGLLRRIASSIRQTARGGVTKCEFFFEDNNVAAQWNDPQDGSLICNGVRTDCQFYTGEAWKYATDPNLEPGRMIKAEAIQELRFRSDDWTRFSDPEQEFRTRFAQPFIWAFKQYIDVPFTPDVEDLLIYKPKVLFGNDQSISPDDDSKYQTMEIQRVSISNFENLEFSRNRSRIQPGSESTDRQTVPQFADTIREFSVPTVSRLEITHPKRSDDAFIYRMWSPDKNKITLFGTGTPDSAVYVVNDTALKERNRYHEFLGTINLSDGVPTAVPGAPNFTTGSVLATKGAVDSTNAVGVTALKEDLFDKLDNEKRLNDSAAPLGFDISATDTTGFWSSVQEVDLVHNKVNTIYVFILLDAANFIWDSVKIDCRFLHSLPYQRGFRGKDFSMISSGESSKLGINSEDTVKRGEITASVSQLVGSESVGFDHGYYAWRFKDRNLRFGTLNADNDLKAQNPIADEVSSLLITEADAGAFINSVAYEVTQYRKEATIENWYLVGDCGFIMIEIPDNTAHRVLPMPDQKGDVRALSNVLVNGGAKGSIVAQFALESATLNIGGQNKNLVQVYRDPDGFGLPANYIVLGPSPEVEQAFGRPVPGRDTVKITYTYLQAQDTTINGELKDPVQGDDVVKRNYYDDNLRAGRSSTGTFDAGGNLTVGGEASESDDAPGPIRREQQDWCYVFKDSSGRPIGRKIIRFMVMYYNMSCISVEIFYNWAGSCQTYALIPDLFLQVGDNGGTLTVPPKGTTDPDDPDLQLGFRVRNLIGDNTPCGRTPHCGDHELIRLGPLRREFEVIVRNEGGSDAAEQAGTAGQETVLKANFPGAGGPITGEIVSSEPPGSQFQKRRGPLWYPYTLCERPRYDFRTNGPIGTDSTELVNWEQAAPGVSSGQQVPSSGEIAAGAGAYGGLPRQDLEAYHGPDRVVPKILDIHPSLRPCTVAYTYGNQVLKGGGVRFTGVARRRGEVDIFWYEGLQWDPPPFGNFGRGKLQFEVATKVGDFVGGKDGKTVGFRWMPMFPERLDMRGNMDSPFTEEVEPVHLRLIQESNPVGGLSETVDENRKFTHKELIQNVVGASVEYPYVPYWPSFRPDDKIGTTATEEKETGTITTQWAWREFDKPIRRGLQGDVLGGIRLTAPEYFIDNRRLEKRLRPSAGNHTVTWQPPQYNAQGQLTRNASLQLDNGPPREIIVDFANRNLNVAFQEDTVYDTTKDVGDTPFPCTNGTATDNPRLSSTCSCDPNTDVEFEPGDTVFLPARVLHLDELGTVSEFALYESTQLQTPFAIDLDRASNLEPCCMCIYTIPGIFFTLDLEFLPSASNVNPAFSNDVDFQYTWSRVPHGIAPTEFSGGQAGLDGRFQSNEDLADGYISSNNAGGVFRNGVGSLDYFEVAAGFPSTRLAQDLIDADGDSVLQVAAYKEATQPNPPQPGSENSEYKQGAVPATGNISRGEDELIILDMLFDSYVKVNSVAITFFVGRGWQAPNVKLGVVDPQFRGEGAAVPTLRPSRIIGETGNTQTGGGLSFDPGPAREESSEGLPNGKGALWTVNIIPDYADESFWNRFGQEFHLIFDQRDGVNSMGIANIVLNVEAMSGEISERVEIFERKYFTSTAAAAGSVNPEEKLQGSDSATGYWRTTDQAAIKGGNRFRAYAWGTKLNDGDINTNPPIEGDAQDLEELQEEEYDAARDLLSSPYEYAFVSFFPDDEKEQIQFYGGNVPEFSTKLSLEISPVEEVLRDGIGDPIYGVIPQGRSVWHAPGHTWTYEFVENYAFCCFPCVPTMVIDYKFAHLHDSLAVVESARFWDELPSGFTRLIRSTIMSPDVTFGQQQQSGANISGGSTGQAVLLDEGLFNNIPVEVLENAGFRRSADGNGLVLLQGGE